MQAEHEPPTADSVPAAARVAGGLAMIVVVAALVVLVLRDTEASNTEARDRTPSPSAPVVGVVCPNVAIAARSFAVGNEPVFARAVRAAARTAVNALDDSGQDFGEAEESALRLQEAYELGGFRSRRIEPTLDRARGICIGLGEWPSD